MAKKRVGPLDLNKLSLSDLLAERLDISRSLASEAIEGVFDIIANTVAQGGRVSITNFGSFGGPMTAPRVARNPQTGERIQVPERRRIAFAPSDRLVEFANSADPSQATIRKRPRSAVSE